MRFIIQKNEDNIIEYINRLILDHICENRSELVDEIKKIITPILQAKKPFKSMENKEFAAMLASYAALGIMVVIAITFFTFVTELIF